MKKEMGKLDLGFADPKEIVQGILKGEIPTPACIFCGKIANGTLLVFSSQIGQYAFCAVCENCITPSLIQVKMDVIEKRVSEIYLGGGSIKLDEQTYKGKVVSRTIGEA
jgi:hypothetical protein